MTNLFSYKPEQYIYVFYIALAFLLYAIINTVNVGFLWLIPIWLVYSYFAVTNSAGFHRLFSHGSYKTSKFWEFLLLISGTLTCYGSSLQWTVMHTQHHKYSDTEKDPHQFTNWTSIFKNNYQINGEYALSTRKAMRRLLKKPWHKTVHQYYWLIPISFMLFLYVVFGWNVLLYFYLAPLGLVILSASVFNYLSHINGKPNNTAYYALQSSGEWRHKLHHDEPWRWDLREKWYHIDLGAYFIMLIKKD